VDHPQAGRKPYPALNRVWANVGRTCVQARVHDKVLTISHAGTKFAIKIWRLDPRLDHFVCLFWCIA